MYRSSLDSLDSTEDSSSPDISNLCYYILFFTVTFMGTLYVSTRLRTQVCHNCMDFVLFFTCKKQLKFHIVIQFGYTDFSQLFTCETLLPVIILITFILLHLSILFPLGSSDKLIIVKKIDKIFQGNSIKSSQKRKIKECKHHARVDKHKTHNNIVVEVLWSMKVPAWGSRESDYCRWHDWLKGLKSVVPQGYATSPWSSSIVLFKCTYAFLWHYLPVEQNIWKTITRYIGIFKCNLVALKII